MIAGVPNSNNFFKRLFLVITRRYKSFKSLVAKRPPSNCNIGRRSGGITGNTVITIHSGWLSLSRKASTVSKRLINFLRLSPVAFFSSSVIIAYSFSKSTCSNKVFTASAPVWATKLPTP